MEENAEFDSLKLFHPSIIWTENWDFPEWCLITSENSLVYCHKHYILMPGEKQSVRDAFHSFEKFFRQFFLAIFLVLKVESYYTSINALIIFCLMHVLRFFRGSWKNCTLRVYCNRLANLWNHFLRKMSSGYLLFSKQWK